MDTPNEKQKEDTDFKTLKDLGATPQALPNRSERRRKAKKRGLFKKENRGQWKWLTLSKKEGQSNE